MRKRFDLGSLKRYAAKIKNNKEVYKEISNFEDDSLKFICEDCQSKIIKIKRSGRNVLILVSKKKTFCPDCNDKLAKRAAEIFVKLK